MSLTILTHVLTVIKLFFWGGGEGERLRIMLGAKIIFFNNATFTTFSQQILYDKLLLVD